MTFWKTQHFKALQKAWYERLKDAGFQDAEEIVGDDLKLRQNAEHVYRPEDRYRDSKEHYYNVVSQKVEETVFTNEVDRLILVWHADGKKIRSICDDLESLGHGRCRQTVRGRIRIYLMSWGLRTYTPKQLNGLKGMRSYTKRAAS